MLLRLLRNKFASNTRTNLRLVHLLPLSRRLCTSCFAGSLNKSSLRKKMTIRTQREAGRNYVNGSPEATTSDRCALVTPPFRNYQQQHLRHSGDTPLPCACRRDSRRQTRTPERLKPSGHSKTRDRSQDSPSLAPSLSLGQESNHAGIDLLASPWKPQVSGPVLI
jgi:hypothetical protein